MRLRSLAAIVLLLLVAVTGVVAVRELTRPQAAEPVEPIKLNPGGAARDDAGARRARRGEEDDVGRGFAAPTPQPTDPDAGRAPEQPAPQIEVPTPPAVDSDDDGGDG